MSNEQQEYQKKGDLNKVYFLIAVVIVLLGTNVYLYFKNQKTNERVLQVTDEKSKLQTDIDKIEVQLDSANSVTVKLSDEMKAQQDTARRKIAELRVALKRGKLTLIQLTAAQDEIRKLRDFVVQYTAQIDSLKKENANLTTERNTLKVRVDSVSQKAGTLQKQNEDLNNKVTVAAALKSGSVEVVPLKVRKNGKDTDAPKAKNASKLRINFTAVNNALAAKGMHDVFIRIMDPSGAFIAGENGRFVADGGELLYTYKTSIEFTNEDKDFSVDWVNSNAFQKGTYSVILYADGYTMGKGSVTLQ
jgi:uncharacterized protein (UPF0333 family)